MPNHAKHRGATRRSGRGSAQSHVQRYPQPGRRKAQKQSPSLGVVPALAGVASLVAAASGAVVLQPSGSLSAHADDGEAPHTTAAAAARALTAVAVEEARRSAVDRANRSGVAREAQQQAAAEREREAAEAAEFRAWEKARAKEISQVEKRVDEVVKTEFVLERVTANDWMAPLASYRLSARFGQAGGYWSSGYHTGQDFAATSGSPIFAVGAGEVVSASYSGAYGNRVKIRHEDGTETWYAHMSGFAVSAGEWVEAGDTIGYVGSTGNSTGPHLHFEVHTPYGEQEPLSWLRDRGVDV